MTWLAFPLTAFISLQAVDAPVAPSAQAPQNPAVVVAERYPGASAGTMVSRERAGPVRRDSAPGASR